MPKDAKEVLRDFQAFKAFVKKEANASIPHFECDNGKGGYDNQIFEDFPSANGISFEPVRTVHPKPGRCQRENNPHYC